MGHLCVTIGEGPCGTIMVCRRAATIRLSNFKLLGGCLRLDDPHLLPVTL